MEVRNAEMSEVAALARLWHDGWQDAHADILLAELKRLRTLENFTERLPAMLAETRVVGNVGEPLGFCTTAGDELYQLYVSAEARGKGVAAALIADAEKRFTMLGISTAWLACAIGNHRAARFYEKSGWHLAGNMINRLETPEGEFLLEVWKYEKSLKHIG